MTPSIRPLPAQSSRPVTRRAWQWVGLVVAVLIGLPATAAQSRAPDGPGTRASASLDFRIVIPEAVRFTQGQEQRDRTRQFTSRTVESIDGRQVTTVARP